METSAWERILEKYGLPILVLAILVYALWRAGRALFPYVTKFFEDMRAEIAANRELAAQQLDKANTRADRQQQEFLAALKEERTEHSAVLKETTEALTEALGKQTQAIERMGEKLEDRGRDKR